MQILRAAATSSPVLSREAELTLTRSIVSAHHDAWAACLGAECVRATRRAVLLSTACDVAGRPNVLIPVDTTEVPLAEVASIAALARPADPARPPPPSAAPRRGATRCSPPRPPSGAWRSAW